MVVHQVQRVVFSRAVKVGAAPDIYFGSQGDFEDFEACSSGVTPAMSQYVQKKYAVDPIHPG
jgi:hypothetical protein